MYSSRSVQESFLLRTRFEAEYFEADGLVKVPCSSGRCMGSRGATPRHARSSQAGAGRPSQRGAMQLPAATPCHAPRASSYTCVKNRRLFGQTKCALLLLIGSICRSASAPCPALRCPALPSPAQPRLVSYCTCQYGNPVLW